jgi:transposase
VISPPSNTNIWIAAGITDMRRGFTGLSAAAQTVLEQNPYSGHVFVFRGKRGDLVKVLWWDGDGLCLFAKRLERGRFVWPQADKGVVSLSARNSRCCSRASTGEGRSERPRPAWRYRTSLRENVRISSCHR